MLTKNMLKDFSLEALCELMILKLDELKDQKDNNEMELYKVTEAEVKLLQRLINQRKQLKSSE